MKQSKPRPSEPLFTTAHNLAFLSCAWERDPEWNRFKIGTCEGLWRATALTYDILSIVNDVPGNGHFDDVLQWFENSSKRDRKNLRIIEIMNKDFFRHLIEKRGFVADGADCIKTFT